MKYLLLYIVAAVAASISAPAQHVPQSAKEALLQFLDMSNKRYTTAQTHLMEQGVSFYEVRIHWNRELDSLSAVIRREKDNHARHLASFAWLRLVSMMPETYDTTLMETVLRAIPPGSPLWELPFDKKPSAIALTASYPYREHVQQYLESVADSHALETVRMQTLYDLVQEAWWAQDRAGVQRYNALLAERFPNAELTAMAQRDFPAEAKIAIGHPGPDFLARDIDDTGRVFSKSSFHGNYVLWDFWFPGCKPCVAEMPFLHEAHRRFADRGLQIASVCIGSRRQVPAFREQWPMPWLHVEQVAGPGLHTVFEAVYYPRTVLIDADGVIVEIDGTLHGNRPIETLEKLLEADK